MKVDKTKALRLGVYSFFDKQGVVDQYVEYFLEEFGKNITDLVIVSNGTLSAEGRKKLLKYTDKIIERENKGFDIWGYKTGFDYFGWEKLCEYDEIVVTNDTLMGPVYPFSEMFDEMADRDLDFWGLIRHYRVDFDPFGNNGYGYIPEHIQSFFHVYRKSFVRTADFQEYWDNLPELNTYEDAVGRHEVAFTKKFGDKGYIWDTYVDTDDIRDLNPYLLMFYPKLLVEQKKCPVFKRKLFSQAYDHTIHNTVGQAAVELYDYICNNNLYNVEFIWENILRTCNLADIMKNLQLQYILPSDIALSDYTNKNKIALIMYLSDVKTLDWMMSYASSMPDGSDIYMLIDSLEKKEVLEKNKFKLNDNKIEVRLIDKKYGVFENLFRGMKDVIMNYDMVCFVNDNQNIQTNLGSTTESCIYKCMENILHSQLFVHNVIYTFMQNPRLGILTSPIPNHVDFFTNLGCEWGSYFERTKELADSLGINIPISKNSEPIVLFGACFWFRPIALLKLFDFDWNNVERRDVNNELNSSVERICPYAAQQAGYYPGILMVDRFARMEVTNLSYYVREYNKVICQNKNNERLYFGVVLDLLKGNTVLQLQKYMEDVQRRHDYVSNEWTKTAAALIELQELHRQVSDEWMKTIDTLHELEENHKYVSSEWAMTANALHELQNNHEYVVNEWKKTYDELLHRMAVIRLKELEINEINQMVELKQKEIEEKNKYISGQNEQIAKLNSEITGIRESISWKISSPIRWIMNLFGR